MAVILASSTALILVNLLLAVVALAIGFMAGAWFLGSKKADPEEQDTASEQSRLEQHLAFERAALASSRLKDLASGVACDVGEHNTRVEEITAHLKAAKSAPAAQQTAEVASALAQIVEANEGLQAKLAKAEQQIQAQAEEIAAHESEARTDSLTGLNNRRAFDDHLNQRFAEWTRKQTRFALIICDVDKFKVFNDTHGHQAGDEVLRKVAACLKGVVREMDIPCRYGGEEFALILPATAAADACGLVERLRKAVEKMQVTFEEKSLKVTASFGLAQSEEEDDTLKLLKRADEALYAAKDAGRNCSYLHDGTQMVPIAAGGAPAKQRAEKPPTATLDKLPNRTRFADELRRRLAEADRTGDPLSIVAIDVRGFDPMCRDYGEAIGLLTLDSLAMFLTSTLREMDLLGRLDDSHFALMLPGASLDEAEIAAERAVTALASCKVPVGDKQVGMETVMGVAECQSGDSAATLVSRATAAVKKSPISAGTALSNS
ncbi:MAG: diguanylate cyclase [Planctomycetota bacterium]